MRRRRETAAYFCTIVLALVCVAAKPKSQHTFKPVRPMDVPDGISEVRKAEPVTPPPGSVSKIAPQTRAASVMVIDARSGEIFYEKNADAPRAAASTQKLLTALIVAERGFLDRSVMVEPVDTMAEPVKLNIKPGETYSRIELLRALLVKSPNDVARCLARDTAGSVEAFAELMNQKARELGATHSHFVNPNGLPMPGQYSSARDLSIIAKSRPTWLYGASVAGGHHRRVDPEQRQQSDNRPHF